MSDSEALVAARSGLAREGTESFPRLEATLVRFHIGPVRNTYWTNMEATTIALDREAYDLLRKAKHPGESFSVVVKRLARPRKPLSSFAGTWDHLTVKEVQEIRETLKAERKADRVKSQKLHRGRD